MRLSITIAAKSKNDPKLADLLEDISHQDFPWEFETLIITEGTSESAKGIGIKRAQGDVIAILSTDNRLCSFGFLAHMYNLALQYGAVYPARYFYDPKDDILNRYFALMGCNDPVPYYLKKCDRASYLSNFLNEQGTIGDNGFFIQRKLIEKTDLDNYFHIDNAIEAAPAKAILGSYIWHRTGGNLFTFFKKRYKYGLQHFDNRRWRMVTLKDIPGLLWFILCSITLFQPLSLSLRGYKQIPDAAWFMHPLVCLMSVITYGILTIDLGIKRLFQSLSAPWTARRA